MCVCVSVCERERGEGWVVHAYVCVWGGGGETEKKNDKSVCRRKKVGLQF